MVFASAGIAGAMQHNNTQAPASHARIIASPNLHHPMIWMAGRFQGVRIAANSFQRSSATTLNGAMPLVAAHRSRTAFAFPEGWISLYFRENKA
jgi:hypothetical protein